MHINLTLQGRRLVAWEKWRQRKLNTIPHGAETAGDAKAIVRLENSLSPQKHLGE